MSDDGTTRAAKAEAQRSRILGAAQKCFIDEGFHAATMAVIAATAGVSPGLIYRYFENKNAIVLAIIERELEGRRAKISELHDAEELLEALAETFRQWQARESCEMNAALLLEMSAAGTRDRPIREALQAADSKARAEFAQWLQRPRAERGLALAPDAAQACALLLQCLVDGLAVRAAREPDLDLARVKAALDRAFELLK